MTKLLVCLLFAAAVVAANPYVETFLSEVGVDPAHQFVELHCAPQSLDTNLTNWQIITSSSTCTLTCWLEYDTFLVVDSEALASGDVGFGSVRINPLGDSIKLVDNLGEVQDVVHFPRYPTGYDSAPLPSATGSISFWNYDDFEGQWMNWYIDSTPTPGEANNDYSVIAGSVTGTGGITLDEVVVWASGPHGDVGRGLYHEANYSISGLGAGTYQVSAWTYYNGHNYNAVYPESVTIGYSQTVGGIDIVIPLTGVAEAPPVAGDWLSLSTWPSRGVRIHSDRMAFVTVTIRDHLGRVVLKRGLAVRPGWTQLPLRSLAAGVYFINCTSGQTTIRKKHVMP